MPKIRKKPNISKECLSKVKESLPSFSDEDMHEYAVKVFRAMDRDGLNVSDAMKSVGNETIAELFNRSSTTQKNIEKFEKLSNLIESGEADQASLYIKRYKSLGTNVYSAQVYAKEKLNSAMFDEMSPESFKYLKDENNRVEILQALDGKDVSPEAKKVAEHLLKYKQYANAELVTSTALPITRIKKNRFLGNVHNRGKIISSGRNLIQSAFSKEKFTMEQVKERWKSSLKEHLDIEETFGDTKAANVKGGIDEKAADEIIDNTFENITTGKSEIFTKSLVANDREALANKKHQFYVFKDWESWGAYDDVYGTGDLYESIIRDIESSGDKIGIASILGDSPYNTHLDLTKVQVKAGLPKVPSKSLWHRNVELYFQDVIGVNQGPASVTTANIFANIRSISAMPRLLKLTFMSLPDATRMASFADKWGYGFWEPLMHDLKHTFNFVKSEERAEVAKDLKFALRNEFGFLGRYVDASNASEAIRKFSGSYYRNLGVNALDTGRKVSAATTMARGLGRNSGKKFSELPERMQDQLSKFISEPEWDLIRKYKSKRFNIITADSARSVTDGELSELRRLTGVKTSLAEMRNDLDRKVYSLFNVAAENAVLMPGAFERAWLYQGTQPGTVSGEILRMIGQFKSYPLAGIDRVYAQRFMDKDSTSSKIMWATQMFAATLPMNFLITYMDYASQGLSMPDPSMMPAGQRARFYMSMIESSFGVFYKVLDPKEQQSDLISTMFNGPGLRMISDTASTVFGVPQGNLKPAKKLVKDILPVQTVPFISPLLEEIMGEKPYLQPGQHKLY